MTDATIDTVLASPGALAGMVGVQPGSVVSRTLVKNSGGTLTLFAFDEGQGLSEHSTPHEATVLVLEGSARVTIRNEEHLLDAGEVLHLPATVPHALHADRPFKMLLVMLRSGS